MLDAYVGRSILIAATNHQSMLDVAVWRRFEEVFMFEPPNVQQLRLLLGMKLRGVRREFELEDSPVISMFKGMSHADVERVLRRAIKEMLLAGREFLSIAHIESAVGREKFRPGRKR
jgi:AAA+ superfamily predicted ATPase